MKYILTIPTSFLLLLLATPHVFAQHRPHYPSGGDWNWRGLLTFFVLLFFVCYWAIRSEQKKAKKRAELLSKTKKNDRVT